MPVERVDFLLRVDPRRLSVGRRKKGPGPEDEDGRDGGNGPSMLIRLVSPPSRLKSFVGGGPRPERRRKRPPAGRSPRVSDRVRWSFPGRGSSSLSSGVPGGVDPDTG